MSVDWVADLTADRSFSELDETDRIRKALGEQHAWLGSLLGHEGAVVDERWMWNPADGQLKIRLVARVSGKDAAAARGAAKALQDRLFAVPPQVGVSALSEAAITAAIDPFVPHRDGSAEIRKRTATAVPHRPDAGIDRYWAPHPFQVSDTDWSNLLHQISRLRQQVVLSVALESAVVDPGALADLDRLGTVFSRLARDGEMRSTGLYSGPLKLAPDLFAVDAQKIYADMARRYRDRVFRFRIAVASPEPLDDGFLHLVGATISPPDTSKDQTFLTRELSGDAHLVVRPRSHDEAIVFSENLSGIGLEAWGPNTVPAPFGRVASLAGLVDITEATAAFRLPVASNGVLPVFPVRRPAFAVRVDLSTGGSDVDLGEQLVGGVPEGRVGMPLDDLTMHAFVVGTTGSGKTSTVIKLLDEVWRVHGVPFMVIEPINSSGDDYRWLLGRQGFEQAIVVMAGDDAIAPLRINPFQVPSQVRVGEHVANLLACFDAAFGLWDPLPAIYRRALEQTYLEAGWSLDDVGGDSAVWPSLQDFVEEMYVATEGLEYAGEARSNILAASRVRVEQLRNGPARSVFDCVRSTPLRDLLGRPAIVELARVGAGNEQELALVIAMLLNSFAELRRSLEPSRRLTHLIVVEEAHKLLRSPQQGSANSEIKGDASGAAARLFASLLAEIRKYGQGIVIADQDPAKLVPDAYKNTNLKVMHRLPHADDRRLVGASMQFDEDHEREAAALLRHHAFVHAEGFDRPALVRIPNIRESDPRELPGDAVIRERYAVARSLSPSLEASVAPYAECAGCPARCLYRSRAFALSASRTTAKGFTELMAAWKPEMPADAKEVWWQRLDEFLVGLVSTRGGLDSGGALSLEGCLLMHLLRGLYRNGRDPWIRRWRARHELSGTPGAETANAWTTQKAGEEPGGI